LPWRVRPCNFTKQLDQTRERVPLRRKRSERVLEITPQLTFILAEGLYDTEFVGENVTGLDQLRRAVSASSPEFAAARAQVDRDDLIMAARRFGSARRGYVAGGTGPSMSGPGTVVEYLALVLDTLAGHWLRAGECVVNAGTLTPAPSFKAQASPPRPALSGIHLRVRGLSESAAGLPTAAAADEMLMPGERQLRALISCSGNPVAS
jgi:anaerobic selenocysteine-containing dehydrogenase